MPFTPSHAVVALPFLRTPLVPAAIAIGAMAPDLPLFFRVGIPYGVTHDWLGMLWTSLPLAVALFLLWRLLVRQLVPALSPRWLRMRWPAEWSDGSRAAWRSIWAGGAVGVLLLVASFLIGTASHILWDLFTHPGRWGSETFPVLAMAWGPLDGTQWLQYGSSVLGLAVLAVWGVLWLRRRTPVEPRPGAPRWLAPAFWVVVAIALVVPGIVEYLGHGIPDAGGLSQAVFRWGTAAGAAILVAGLTASVIAAVWRSMPGKQGDTPGMQPRFARPRGRT